MVYTDEQKAEALDLYVEVGPAEAGSLTGIPSGTIRSWAHRADLPRLRYQKTEEATQAAQVRAEQKRAELQELLLDQAVDLMHRMNAPHKDFKGKDALEVWWEKAPAAAVQNYATSVAILIDKYRLEMGETTGRTEVLAPIDLELARIADEHARQS
jgi:hypothetical protein